MIGNVVRKSVGRITLAKLDSAFFPFVVVVVVAVAAIVQSAARYSAQRVAACMVESKI